MKLVGVRVGWGREGEVGWGWICLVVIGVKLVGVRFGWGREGEVGGVAHRVGLFIFTGRPRPSLFFLYNFLFLIYYHLYFPPLSPSASSFFLLLPSLPSPFLPPVSSLPLTFPLYLLLH